MRSTYAYSTHPPVSATFDPQISLSAKPRVFANAQYYNQYPQPGPSRVDNPQLFSLSEDYEEEEEELYEEEEHDRRGNGRGSSLGGPRVAGACDACKQSKVRCVMRVPGAKCQRCTNHGHECHISGRKQKPPPPSHAELQSRLREKDDLIRHLLDPSGQAVARSTTSGSYSPESNTRPDQRHPSSHAVLPDLPVWEKRTPKHEVERRVDAWITEARRRIMQGVSEGSGENNDDSMETPRWKMPSQPTDPNATPEILTSGVITLDEGKQLFDVFYDKINMFFTVCDPVIHTPDAVLRTNPFLYTTICAIASRHYTRRRDLHQRLLHSAKAAAGAALNGTKSAETCQAYLLLGVYHPPSRSFAEDRNYLYLGLACRIATELELHLPPLPSCTPHTRTETSERQLLNRARVWLNCFCTDRSISTQLGKPSAISFRRFPYDLGEWWRSSPYSAPHDIHMCAYASLLQVMSGFHEAHFDDGVRKKVDLRLVQSYADKLTAVGEEWKPRIAENSAKRPNPKTTWRDNLWPFMVSYAKLVVVSIGLQDGMRQGLRHDNPFSKQCIDTASDILTHVTETLYQLGYLRYSVESYFVFVGFAAAFLLKILQPKFSFMMYQGCEEEIVQLVQRLIDVLGSDEVAIDARHTPKLYSRFLAGVLADKYKSVKNTTTTTATQQEGPTLPPPPQAPPPQAPASFAPPAFPPMDVTPTPAPGVQYDYSFAPSMMDIDPGGDMMLSSMAAITDPRFWDQAAMPGFSWTGPGPGWAQQQWGLNGSGNGEVQTSSLYYDQYSNVFGSTF